MKDTQALNPAGYPWHYRPSHFPITGLDRVISNFTSRDEALAETSAAVTDPQA